MAGNYEEFRKHGKEMVDYICDYMKTLDERNVAPTIDPGFLVPLLDDHMPEKPESFDAVMEDIDKKIMQGVLHWNHKNFFAYFGSGNAYPSVLAEMLSSAIGAIGFSWASCPSLTELEKIMLDWFAKALDLPKFFLSRNCNPDSAGGGSIQSTASDAVYACMMAARARAIRTLKGGNDLIYDSEYLPRLVCYSSSEAHSCVEKAAKMGLVKLRIIEPDSRDVMRGAALEQAIAQDVERGLTPFFVVATMGTTAQAAFDNLEEIGAVCKKYPSIWFHCDAAFGGSALIVPEMRHLQAGMELLDSLDINPNKLLMTAFDCTCLWVKSCIEFTTAFAIDPLYLQHQHDHAVMDLRHFGTPLSRRFRSLKLFFMFRMYGLEGLQSYVRRVIEMGKLFEEMVKADKRFEVRNDVQLGLVCFRLVEPDTVNQEFLACMNRSGKIHLTPAKVKGKYIIRFMASQENCNMDQIQGAWKIIQDFAEEILAERKPRLSSLESHRHSFSRNVSQDAYERVSKTSQQLMDGATPILVVDDSENASRSSNSAQRNSEESSQTVEEAKDRELNENSTGKPCESCKADIWHKKK